MTRKELGNKLREAWRDGYREQPWTPFDSPWTLFFAGLVLGALVGWTLHWEWTQ